MKNSVKRSYRLSVHEQYYPLVPTTVPHDEFWNVGFTRREAIGSMAFFPVHECRFSTEKIGQGSKLGTNMDNLIQLGVKTDLWVEVKATDEIMMRRFLYWMPSYFMDECQLEDGISYQNEQRDWIEKSDPPPAAVISSRSAARRVTPPPLTLLIKSSAASR